MGACPYGARPNEVHMAQTTTAITANDVAIYLDDDGGTPVDISGSSNEIGINLDNDLLYSPSFGGEWINRYDAGKDAGFKISVVYSTANDEAVDILNTWYFTTQPGDRTLSIYIPDDNPGSNLYQAEVKIGNLSMNLGSGDASPVLVTASFRPNGSVALSTVST